MEDHNTFDDELFLRNTHYGYLVHIYACFEAAMIDRCKAACKSRSHDYPEKNSFWETLEATVGALHRNTNVVKQGTPYVSGKKDWDAGQDLSKIRNCIAHQFGVVANSKYKTRLKQLESSVPGYSIGGNGRIRIDTNALHWALEVTSKLAISAFSLI